jgi:hypothetical protein
MLGVMVALSVIGASMLNFESRLSMKTATFTGNPPYSMPPCFHCVTTVSAVKSNQLVACRKGEDRNPDCRDRSRSTGRHPSK